MRIAFDVDRFRECITLACEVPCTKPEQKQMMTPALIPVCAGLMQYDLQNGAPKTQNEMSERITLLLCAALAIGFDAGRIYEDKERSSRIELVQ